MFLSNYLTKHWMTNNVLFIHLVRENKMLSLTKLINWEVLCHSGDREFSHVTYLHIWAFHAIRRCTFEAKIWFHFKAWIETGLLWVIHHGLRQWFGCEGRHYYRVSRCGSWFSWYGFLIRLGIVCLLMRAKLTGLREGLVTVVALVWFLTSMEAYMLV